MPTANADASLEVQVEDLVAIIKTLKIGPAHLVGHSYGGAVALQLALRHPELVRTLVLSEPGVASVLDDAPEDVRIPDATHWLPHDQPQKFNEALLDFLANYKQPDEFVQRVDHLVYATPSLDRGIDEIEKLLGGF